MVIYNRHVSRTRHGYTRGVLSSSLLVCTLSFWIISNRPLATDSPLAKSPIILSYLAYFRISLASKIHALVPQSIQPAIPHVNGTSVL